MGTTVEELKFLLTGDSTGARKALTDVLGGVSEVVSTAGTRIGQAGAMVGTALAQHAAEIEKFTHESVDAYGEQEAAVNKLKTALKAQGNATPEVMRQYEQLATTFQRTTVFSDELVDEMQALLVQVGNVAPGQMKAALTAATNLSAGLGIDLRTATMAVAKAFDGGGTAIGKMVPSLRAIIKEGASTDEVLAALNERFGGQAQAQLDTYAGKQKNIANQINEFQEKVGGLVVSVLTPLMDFFVKAPAPVQMVTVALVGITTALVPLSVGLGALAVAFGTTIPVALAAVTPFLLPAGAILVGITAIYEAWKHWDQIVAFVKNVYNAVKEWLVDKFVAIIDSVKAKVGAVTGFFKNMYDSVVGHSFVPDMVEGIKREFGKLGGEAMVTPAQGAVGKVINAFANLQSTVMSHVNGLVGKLGSLFGGAGGGTFGSLLSMGLSAVMGPAGPLAGLVAKGIGALGGLAMDGLKKVWGGIKNLFGGPSGAQQQGREMTANFQEDLANLLTSSQQAEAGNETWKMSIIAVTQEYQKYGLTGQQAMDDLAALWKSAEKGPKGAAAAIQLIQDRMKGLAPVTAQVADQLADLNVQGGSVFDRIHQIRNESAGMFGGGEGGGAQTEEIPSFANRPMERVVSQGLAMLHPGDVVGVPQPGQNVARGGGGGDSYTFVFNTQALDTTDFESVTEKKILPSLVDALKKGRSLSNLKAALA